MCIYESLESVQYSSVPLMLKKSGHAQDEECLRPGDATDLTFLERLEEKMGNHPHFVT